LGCKNRSGERSIESPINSEKQSKQNPKDNFEEYDNEHWQFSIEFPEHFHILESELPGKSPVVNLFPGNSGANTPLGIHEKPELAYISILPKGFGVDGPAGSKKSFSKANLDLSISADLDKENSIVYLLEDGKAWAYFLKFNNAPDSWKRFGGIFVHFRISNFKAECFDPENNRALPVSQCDPMGKDEVRYSGQIDSESRDQIHKILESFEFRSPSKKDISELIKVEEPLPNLDVTSPLKIVGKARGYWFFEASAPIAILDKDFNKIAESYIEAEGEWMTEEFVYFTGSIEFDAPDDERGYLLFRRANPSGHKENERTYRIPILFPPK
ncbi:MAG: Gmad2 immunoglobulin-like domain-containing protein, partial [Christiangramia sp.]|nr:Gmad2 immunoglobulin-like domain-containing protein [Christiangramia sp.]